MAYVVTGNCLDVLDRSCLDACPVDCLYEGEGMMFIDPEECVDCGACELACPVEAIWSDDQLPEDESRWIATNRDFFAR